MKTASLTHSYVQFLSILYILSHSLKRRTRAFGQNTSDVTVAEIANITDTTANTITTSAISTTTTTTASFGELHPPTSVPLVEANATTGNPLGLPTAGASAGIAIGILAFLIVIAVAMWKLGPCCQTPVPT